MDRVLIFPLPAWARTKPRRAWPQHPPIFPEGNPTREDCALALELIAALDPLSQSWYEVSAARLRQE